MFGKNSGEDVTSSRDVDYASVGSYQPALQKYAALIKEYVLNNPNKVIRMEDFNRAVDGTTAPIYVRQLMRLGILVRHKVPGEQPGHTYIYTWDDNKEPRLYNAPETFTGKTDFIEQLEVYASEWQAKQTESTEGDEQAIAMKNLGVTQFVNSVKKEIQAKTQ